jgi:translation initiation factor IF-3
MSTKDALAKAQDLELDLVLIAPNAPTPVAKIIDYGKFKYERKKKEQQKKKNQKVVEVKEVRLTQRIGEHDLQVKLKDARRFLTKGNKVKVSLRFRRNEMNDQSQAMDIMKRFEEELQDIAIVSSKPKLRAIFLDMMLEPNNKKK